MSATLKISIMNFYAATINKILQKNIIERHDSILVVGGGDADKNAFLKNGFKNVVITNVEYDRGVNDYSPYSWEYQDMENLTYGDAVFDWVFVHAGLHHCASPHRALCEMLRVSKKGIGVIEARNSLLNKISISLGFVPEYELEPLVLSRGGSGGLRNSNIPNFIYRWKENEVKRTVDSFLPQYIHKFWYFYGYAIPLDRLSMSPSIFKRAMGKIASVLLPIVKFLFPKQGNRFAFIVSKEGKIQPWLIKNDRDELIFNMDYVKGKFSPGKYTGRHHYQE
jgi:ubiquinone/menaquinone biosynthesis C-methylase UbiE